MTRAVYWIWLQNALGTGAEEVAVLVDEYGDAEAIYHMTAYPTAMPLSKEQRRRLANKDLDEAKARYRTAVEAQAWVLTPEDDLYQALFEGMYAPPAVIYGKGDKEISWGDMPRIAVVGTRDCNDDGVMVTRKLAAGLAAGGAVIVSGGAEGLDSEAMEAALDEGGNCICFQACGIDVEYPKSRTPLRKRVLENGGLILSEFPCGSKAFRHHFRIRNRLISAASCGTLVTQAPKKSGALITASWAAEQGHDVFAVPHFVGDYRSEGTNHLIKEGAFLVTDAADILSHYVMRYPYGIRFEVIPAAQQRAQEACRRRRLHAALIQQTGSPVADVQEMPVARVAQSEKKPMFVPCPDAVNDQTKTVYDALKEEAKTVSELARDLSMTTAAVMTALTVLELHGAVSCLAGQRYVLRESEM